MRKKTRYMAAILCGNLIGLALAGCGRSANVQPETMQLIEVSSSASAQTNTKPSTSTVRTSSTARTGTTVTHERETAPGASETWEAIPKDTEMYDWALASYQAVTLVGKSMSEEEFLKQALAGTAAPKNTSVKGLFDNAKQDISNRYGIPGEIVFFMDGDKPVQAGILTGRNQMAIVQNGTVVREFVTDYGKNFRFKEIFDLGPVDQGYFDNLVQTSAYMDPDIVVEDGVDTSKFDNKLDDLKTTVANEISTWGWTTTLWELDVTAADDSRFQGITEITVYADGFNRVDIMYQKDTGVFEYVGSGY